MKGFACQCASRLHFENSICLVCGTQVAYDPATDRLVRLTDPVIACGQRATTGCNWTAMPGSSLCTSCACTRMVPSLDAPNNLKHLSLIESAKRRMFRSLIRMGLWSGQGPVIVSQTPPLTFDLLETLPIGPPVITGHSDGLITLNIAEASDEERERARDGLREPYRTVLGHFRHEVGHYFWDVLVRNKPVLGDFRAHFGDESADYQAALDRHYAFGPPAGWQTSFVSAYATMHPWEDWAETWAHFMHARATLGTVASFGLGINGATLRVTPFTEDVLYCAAPADRGADFLAWVNAWVVLTAVLNETARSMGQPDRYPFVLNRTVVTKLHFIQCVIAAHGARHPAPPPQHLMLPAA